MAGLSGSPGESAIYDNNVAEYAALLEAVQFAVILKAKALRVYTDSQLVVKQMTGNKPAAVLVVAPCTGYAGN
jgi:ribonuclease HI